MHLSHLFLNLLLCRSISTYPNILPPAQQEVLWLAHHSNIGEQLHFHSTIRDVLLANQIIPQVLDDFEPTYYIQLQYPEHRETVLLGNDIPVDSVRHRPTFTIHSLALPDEQNDGQISDSSTFTLILTDPDALSRQHPVKSEMCHWIITNLTTPFSSEEWGWPTTIAPSDIHRGVLQMPDQYLDEMLAGALSKQPGELEAYLPPGPPKKTGPHRYVFVLLKGNTSNLKPPKERPHWGYGQERHGVRDWAAENKLEVVGVNFFFAQHRKQ